MEAVESGAAGPAVTKKAERARPKVRVRLRLFLAMLVLFAMWCVKHVPAHLKAASLLLHFADPNASGALASVASKEVDVRETTIATAEGDVRAREYLPRGVEKAPGFVLVHGVHRLGIDEPRLVRFARAIAGAGFVVQTPEVPSIADYRVDPSGVETIGAAVHALRTELGAPVGVMGMSFAGGLALLAASDDRFARDVRLVVAVGAHDDLSRVARFFATDRAERPDGSFASMTAHPYGPLVFVYGNLDAFFSPEDQEVAREAVKLRLWDKAEEAKARAEALSPAGRATMAALFAYDLSAPANAADAPEKSRVKAELLAKIDALADRMSEVSPHGQLDGLRAPVFLLHGAGDNVIPPTETLWLARDVPSRWREDVLVSDAIQHVELNGVPTLGDRLKLVHFLADVLEAMK